jgi:hypothetical protein
MDNKRNPKDVRFIQYGAMPRRSKVARVASSSARAAKVPETEPT